MIPMLIGLRQPEAQHTAPATASSGEQQIPGVTPVVQYFLLGTIKAFQKLFFNDSFASEVADLGVLMQIFCFEHISRSHKGPSKTIAICRLHCLFILTQ
jgi:hypothetical protein